VAKKTTTRAKARKGPAKSARKRKKKASDKRRSGGAAGRKKTSAATAAGKARGKAKPTKKTRLTRKELEEFREMLLEKRRTLVGDLNGMTAETSREGGRANLSSMPTHMADVGTDNFEHEFTLGLLESEQALLGEIDEALRRIDERTYGICLGTGKPIPKARLRAKPWAKYTVEYTRLLEKGLVEPPDEQDDAEQE